MSQIALVVESIRFRAPVPLIFARSHVCGRAHRRGFDSFTLVVQVFHKSFATINSFRHCLFIRKQRRNAKPPDRLKPQRTQMLITLLTLALGILGLAIIVGTLAQDWN